MRDGVYLRDVLVVAARTQEVVNPLRETVADGQNDIVGHSISKRRINAFHVFAAFEEVRVQEVGVERILFDVLEISPELPIIFVDAGEVEKLSCIEIFFLKLINQKIVPRSPIMTVPCAATHACLKHRLLSCPSC